MTKNEFLNTLRRRLGGLPATEIEDAVADYAMHFDEGMADGRSEAEIAKALGDPLRLARELRAESGFKRWEEARTPSNFMAALFGFLALVAVDFIFLLPILGVMLAVAFGCAVAAIALCVAGLAVIFGPGTDALNIVAQEFVGISLLGFGIGGGALLVWLGDVVVRLLWKYARLHYTLLNQANIAS